jgi:hypothetical protein
MTDKYWQWVALQVEQDQHSSNASSADCARIKVLGKGSLVEKHLRRIAQREQTLSEFARHIQESRVYRDGEED